MWKTSLGVENSDLTVRDNAILNSITYHTKACNNTAKGYTK